MSDSSTVIQASANASETHKHATDMHEDHRNLLIDTPTLRRPSRQGAYHSPLMLSDPLDSPSSDAKSFDEDDMYGSDSDAETISLKRPCQAAAPDSDASLVCPHLLPQFGFLHMIQDVDVHLQLDRLDMGMSRAMAMLEALCESEGINSSSSMEAESDMSALPLPDGPPSGDVNSFDT